MRDPCEFSVSFFFCAVSCPVRLWWRLEHFEERGHIYHNTMKFQLYSVTENTVSITQKNVINCGMAVPLASLIKPAVRQNLMVFNSVVVREAKLNIWENWKS